MGRPRRRPAAISSTDALTNTTTYAETVDGSGHLVRTTTYPDNTTRIETFYQNGQLLSVTGTAVHGVRYEYGVDANGAFTKEIKFNSDGSDSQEWTKTYADFMGRSSLVVYSDGATSASFYNSKGQLTKQVDPDGVTTLFSYNVKGEQDYTAVDVNQNGVIDYTGTDRITYNEQYVTTANGTTVRHSATWPYTTNGTADTILAGMTETSIDGLQSWQISLGLTNHVETVIDRDNQRRTVTATAPDGSYTVSVSETGRVISVTRYDAVDTQLSAVSYSYDVQGRQTVVTDARTGDTTIAYNNADQQTSVSASGQTTSFGYDSLGRRIATFLPDGVSVTNEYFSTGEPQRTYGARSYPVEYTYDYAGRMTTLKTWKDFAGNAGTATTTWNYSSTRGFLTSKVCDDSSSVTYSNSAAGRLLTRTWARGIVTTYGYNNAGELASIDYSDSTPDAIFTYDRRGRRTQLVDGAGTHVMTYNDAGQLLTESFPNSGVVVTNSYDSLLRRSSLSRIGVSPVQFGYDNASRLSSVSDGTHSAMYAYHLNSSLISNIVFKTSGVTKMTTTKTYDNLNRLTQIRSVDSVSSVVNSDSYSYNTANQRTRVDLADGSYWVYAYDSLGQVISGKKYWSDNSAVAGQQFEYGFDTIGNRTNTVTNSRGASYTANSMNQYTQRVIPGALDVLGTATSNATVTVNNQATARKGEYFYKELASLANSSNAVYTNINIVGVRKNAGTNQQDVVTATSGHEFVPKTPEVFGYDSDGNLTNDARWAYSWDAENRLMSAETSTSVTSVLSAVRQKLLFGYDSQSRRISKVVSNWTGSAWSAATNLRFVYDGWNLVADLNSTNGLVRSYTWGLDLSGSAQGAGGIGGLLSVSAGTNGTHFVAYDGNGNVTALVDANSGSISAQYEWSLFGEMIRATGPMAKANPFRFSTKYQDDETGLLYYGFRYYQPSTGRWPSRDLIGDLGGPNPYSYVRNEPTDFIDARGLAITKYTQDPNALPVTAVDPTVVYMPSLAAVWGITFASYPDTIAVITFSSPGPLGINKLKVSGALTLTLYYNSRLVSDPNLPSYGGYSTISHERHHAALWRDFWNGLKVNVDPLEGIYCRKVCAERARDLANAMGRYYMWLGHKANAQFHISIGAPLSAEDTAALSNTSIQNQYQAAAAAFTTAGCSY